MAQTQIPSPQPSEIPPSQLDQPPTKHSGKKKWLVAGLVVILIVAVGVSAVFFLGKNSPVNAVTTSEPFTVYGVQLQINSTLKQNTYKDPYGTAGDMTLTSPSDTFLVISAKVISESTSDPQIDTWNVTVTDASSRSYQPFMTTAINPLISSSGTLTDGSVEWLLTVPKSQQSFTMNFPDGQQVNLVVP